MPAQHDICPHFSQGTAPAEEKLSCGLVGYKVTCIDLAVKSHDLAVKSHDLAIVT